MSKSLTIHHQDTLEDHPDTRSPDTHQDPFAKTVFGFWLYLMTDCLLFATLFCTFAVLHNSTYGGPSARILFHLPTVFGETMILLFSSFICGCSMLYALRNAKTKVMLCLIVTFLLGVSFLFIELSEFTDIVQGGHSWQDSAFLSSYFTLVGTHGLHITFGMLWIAVMIAQIYRLGVTTNTFRRLAVLNMFWHFLDVVWIFIFTFVYLMGVI